MNKDIRETQCIRTHVETVKAVEGPIVQALDKLLKTEDGNLLVKKNLFVRADALCSLVFDIGW